MTFFKAAWAVFLKDLKVEIRTKEIVLTTILFALLVVVLSAFAFNLNKMRGVEVVPGVLWIAIAFSGILALSRAFQRERDFSVWDAMLMTPAPRAALYLGKMLGVLSFLLVVELALLPILQLFFHAPIFSHLPELLPVLLLGTLGFSAAGTLFGAMTIRTRLRDLLLGIILYPLIAPLLIAGVKATGAILAGDGLDGASFYLGLIVVFDVVFLLGGLWFFDLLMED